MALAKNKLVKRVIAALAIKELVERVQEARQPKKSFVRRNGGKLALLALAGTGFFVYQQRSRSGISLPGGTTTPGFGSREPSIEPDERVDSPLLAPGATPTPTTPAPTG